LAQNLRVGKGEVDIVARIGGETAVVEVRSRWAVGKKEPPDPLDAFNACKAQQVKRLAVLLPSHLRTTRVDLIAVRFGVQGVEIRWVPRV
jgi:Holliday junction resolvase-like predicted endonuclease